uniref:Glyco_trans_2-like domain-containing protein n=1 Tax=Macrostomum lignano TaxID=282301 RepID=A0A1I8GDF4_9PLAT
MPRVKGRIRWFLVGIACLSAMCLFVVKGGIDWALDSGASAAGQALVILRPPPPKHMLPPVKPQRELAPGVVLGVEDDINEVRDEIIFNRVHHRDMLQAHRHQQAQQQKPQLHPDDSNSASTLSPDGFARAPPAHIRELWAAYPNPGHEHGEGGRPVNIDKNKLSSTERRKYDEGWQRNAFNQYASDMISLDRELGDNRDAQCKAAKYPGPLPDTSVIICFHNEAWSVLLRTVHSVINRSPPSLIKEIILVDDASEYEHLKRPLTEYMRYYSPKVRFYLLK